MTREDKEFKEVLARNPKFKELFEELDKVIFEIEDNLQEIKQMAQRKGIKPEY